MDARLWWVNKKVIFNFIALAFFFWSCFLSPFPACFRHVMKLGLIVLQSISLSDSSRHKKIMVTAVDTLLWQTFASIVIPGFTINRICALSLYSLKRASSLPPATQKYITTAIGLGCIPFIFKPIDKLVDIIMDETYRKFIGRNTWHN